MTVASDGNELLLEEVETEVMEPVLPSKVTVAFLWIVSPSKRRTEWMTVFDMMDLGVKWKELVSEWFEQRWAEREEAVNPGTPYR